VVDDSSPGGVTIERDAHTQQFVTVHNRVARDKRLRRAERGLLVEILSLPPGARITAETLAQNGPEGRDAIRAMIKGLEAAGYVVRQRSQDARGRWSTRLIVRETPGTASPMPGEPTPEKPSSVPPGKTQVSAGRTEDGSSGVGKSGAIDLKDELPKDIKDVGDRHAGDLPPAVADALSRMIQGEIRDLTGATLPLDDALRTGRQLLSRRAEPPDNPVEWTRTVIRATPNPRTFLPTPTPPKFTATTPAAAPRQESIEAARAALSHLRRAPSPTGDPLCSLAAAQLSEARAGRTPGSPNDQEAA
jgi:hypothetical protein